MNIESILKELIVARYGSLKSFAASIGMPNSTLATLLSRGIMNASVSNLHAICRELGLSMDALMLGQIVPASEPSSDLAERVTALQGFCRSATIYGEPITETDLQEMTDFLSVLIQIIKNRHKK